MPNWSMGDLAAFSGLGLLSGGGWQGGVLAAISQNAQNLQAGRLQVADIARLPGAVGLHLAFDPNAPGVLYQVAPADGGWAIPKGYDLRNDQVVWSGSGAPPWPGVMDTSTYGYGFGGSAAPDPTLDAISKLAIAGQVVADSADRLDDAVTRAVNNAANIDGSDVGDATAALSDFEETVAQIHDRTDAISNETTLIAAQADLALLKKLGVIAKSQAAKAVRLANRAGQIAQRVLDQQAAIDRAEALREQRADAVAANQQALLDAQFQNQQGALNAQLMARLGQTVGMNQAYDLSMAPQPISYGMAYPQQSDVFLSTPPELSVGPGAPAGEVF